MLLLKNKNVGCYCALSLSQYLNPASLHDPSLQDAEGYRILEQSMDKIGLSTSEKADLFRVVAAVLHLGNITFEENLKDKKGLLLASVCPMLDSV